MKHIIKNTECKIQTKCRRRMFHAPDLSKSEAIGCKLQSFGVPCFISHEHGMTLMLSLIVLSNVMVIALAVGVFGLSQFKIVTSAKESGYAIFAGTSGLEKAFYNTRINPGCAAAPNPISGNLSNGATYSVAVDCASAAVTGCNPIAKATVLTSNGQYGQSKTTREIEGSWCN